MFGRETVDVAALSSNVKIIAESIAQQIYNLTEADVPRLFTNGLVRWRCLFLCYSCPYPQFFTYYLILSILL